MKTTEIAKGIDRKKAMIRMVMRPSTERILFRAELTELTDKYLFGLATRMDAMLN
jgi:hypothetical protein